MKLPSPGEVVGGRFRVDSVIGTGGFATVMSADDLESDRRVAIKFLRPEPGRPQDDTVARFEREVQILARLRSPRIVQLVGHGTTSSGLSYAVFEHLDGEELAELLHERGSLDPPDVREALTQLLEALRDAHNVGVLHRDLKPENVIVTRANPLELKLIDFGIARPLRKADLPQITATGDTIGTIRYMSPEQLKATSLTEASDIYSLGMVGIEMLLGRDGLHGGALHEQFERLRTGHVFSVPMLQELDPELQGILAKMTALKPHDRFQTADEVLQALGSPRRGGRIVAFSLAAVVLLLLFLLGGALAGTVGERPADAGVVEELAARAIAPRNFANLDAGAATKTGVDALDAIDAIDATPSRSALCEPFPHSGRHGLDHRHETLVWADPALGPDEVAGVLVLLADGSGISLEDHRDKMNFQDIARRERLLIMVPATKVDDTGSSWDHSNLAPIAARVSVLLESWCVFDDVPLYLVGEGRGGNAADRWLCVDLTDVRQPTAVAVSAHRYAQSDRRPCDGARPPYLNLVSLRSRVEPVEGGKGCHTDKYIYHSAAEQEGWWMSRYECRGEGTRVEHAHGECRHWDCGYSRCDIDGGRDWSPIARLPGDPAINCVGQPVDFPYQDVVWSFFAAQD